MGRIVFRETGGLVKAGPFQGMKYGHQDAGFTLGPKLLGTYEKELEPIVEQIIASAYPTIINLGAGDGFYAVGLAMRMPGTRVIGFEGFERKQPQIRSLAELNGVADRLEIRGLAAAKDVEMVLQETAARGPALVVCDVEGAEAHLLDPVIAPRLRDAEMLVEMHDIVRKGISAEIHQRFDTSHEIEVIPTRRRRRSDWPPSVPVSRQWSACLAERRGGRMTWSWMKVKPKALGAGSQL